jgi:signal transduction histidine kinase
MAANPRVRSALSQSLDRALVVVGLLCGALVVTEVALLPAGPAGLWIIGSAAVFVVYIVAGLVAWKRRPSNGMGALLIVAGLALYVGGIAPTGVPLLVAVGAVGATLIFPAIAHLLLAFPVGRLPDRRARLLVVALYATSLVLQAPKYLFDPAGPHPPMAIASLPEAVALLGLVQTIVGTTLLILVAGVLWGRLRRAHAEHRRVLVPVFSYGIFTVLCMPLIAIAVDRVFRVDPDVRDLLQLAAIAGVPIAFTLGMLRGGFARTGELEELGTWLGAADASKQPIAAALARALGDPSLRLYFRREDSGELVDADGRAAPPRVRADARRGWQEIALEGRPIGAIEFDAELLSDLDLVRTAGRIVAIAVERERLTAELRASERALVRSRERIVEAGDRERRRVARDLHDGLQVQLVLLALEAQQIAGAAAATVPGRATRLRERIDAAAADLRALVRDLVPAALIERGLTAAAGDLADRMPIPTVLESDIEHRPLGELVEATIYFVLTEALTNVVKHAGASRVRVRLTVEDARVRLDVEDDGVGGASIEGGSGLRGLADRVEAIGGTISISSPQGGGSRLRAEVPCA